MKIYHKKNELQAALTKLREAGKKIALVPTMGALHDGHLSLIKEAQKQADVVICSIFVNPTQFNDPQDLEKYPRPISQDTELLELAQCDILFLPTVEEMYPTTDEPWTIDLGDLDQLWEGAKRPGHFQGVTQIVYKLFRLVMPDIACFGQKDFQQVMVIQRMIDLKELPIQIAICPTIRSKDGLALSSRNTRLSEKGLQEALILYKVLNKAKSQLGDIPFSTIKQQAIDRLNADSAIELEYFALCETRSLHEADTLDPSKKYVALVVAWIEGVRLIDNMLLNP